MTSAAGQTYKRRIVLAGGGLANLHVVTRAGDFHALDTQLVLLDTNPFWFFANMATEVVSGYYGLKDFHLDLRLFAKQYGIEFIQDEIRTLLPQQKKIMTQSGRMLDYDLISFALGSMAEIQEHDVPAEGSFPVKPLKNVLQIRNEVETCLELFPDKKLELAVLGGGASGVEYALNLADLLEERNPKAGWDIVLLEEQPRVLPDFSAKVSRLAESALRASSVRVRTGVEIQHVQSSRLVLEYGETLHYDLAVDATGERVSELFIQAGLETDEHGALRVSNTLQAQNHADIFAGGDCAHIKGCPVRRSTQNAIQQGPYLANNLLAHLKGKKKKTYTGTKQRLRFLSLGKTTALWQLGPLALQGPWVLRWKHHNDRKIMRKLQSYFA